MKVLFVHQNFPGQFGRLAAKLVADPSNQVVAIGESDLMRARGPVPGVTAIGYPKPRGGGKETHHYLRRFEGDVRRGQAAVRAAMDLKKKGFVPDVIYGNPGWGEMLFLKDVYPTARHVALFEFFFRANEGDHGFDPELPVTMDDCLRLRMRNTTLVMSLDVADRIVCPTHWQASRIPAPYQPKVAVVHDGIDTALCRPDASAVFEHPAVPVPLRFGDEVLTYVARNLEPYRGFHWFMRALPKVLAERPQARVVIVGGDAVSYGRPAPDGKTWRETLLAEVGPRLDLSRVHFTGRLPFAQFVTLMQVSGVHAYLTYPFVLSWSVLEAMACGALVAGSDTEPVREIIDHKVDGFRVPCLDPAALAAHLAKALSVRESSGAMRAAARERVVERYDFERVCLPAQLALLRG
ncbi:MAG: glycosyltransferase [bacterium]|jgi:glycosyltransferase involved in cell wall biosynthesis|nr:glycosyltransferase [Betaproteobacteria bacterium]